MAKSKYDEQAAIEAFAKSNDATVEDAVIEDSTDNESKELKVVSSAPEHGYTRIDKSILPFEGKQYAEDIEFDVRPASVIEIRHWSSIDETQNPRKLYDYFNDIINKCVKVINGTTMDIKESDRLWFVFKIHELTFVEAERPTLLKSTCSNTSCKHEWQSKIDVNTLKFDLPDEAVLKYIDKTTGSFHIKTKSYGEIVLTIPSLKVAGAAFAYMNGKSAEWIEENSQFLKLAMFMMKPNITPTVKQFNEAYVQWSTWTPHQLSLMISLVEKCSLSVKQTLTIKCPKCGTESDQAIDLEGGIKSLFLPVSNLTDELL